MAQSATLAENVNQVYISVLIKARITYANRQCLI